MTNSNDWHFEITNAAREDLDKLDAGTQKRVLEKLVWFTANFQKITPLPLGGEWRGFFKLRIGDWRIVYEAKHDVRHIIVHAIDNRNRIYKHRKV